MPLAQPMPSRQSLGALCLYVLAALLVAAGVRAILVRSGEPLAILGTIVLVSFMTWWLVSLANLLRRRR